MQSYTSRAFEVKADLQTLFGWMANPKRLQPMLDQYGSQIPVKEVILLEDGVKVDSGIFGMIEFLRTESNPPHLIAYETGTSPLPIKLLLSLSEASASSSLVQITIEANAPAFLGSMLRHKIEPILADIANKLEAIDFSKMVQR